MIYSVLEFTGSYCLFFGTLCCGYYTYRSFKKRVQRELAKRIFVRINTFFNIWFYRDLPPYMLTNYQSQSNDSLVIGNTNDESSVSQEIIEPVSSLLCKYFSLEPEDLSIYTIESKSIYFLVVVYYLLFNTQLINYFLTCLTSFWLIFKSLPNFYIILDYATLAQVSKSNQTLNTITRDYYLCECGWLGTEYQQHSKFNLDDSDVIDICPPKYRVVRFSKDHWETWLQKLKETDHCLITGEKLYVSKIGILSCGHYASLEALVRWISVNHQCFLCRKELDSYNFR